MSTTNRFGAIKTGGTKVICGWSDENGEILDQGRIPTTTPSERPQSRRLIPEIREKVITRFNVVVREIIKHIEEFIVQPQLGQNAGFKGAAALLLP